MPILMFGFILTNNAKRWGVQKACVKWHVYDENALLRVTNEALAGIYLLIVNIGVAEQCSKLLLKTPE